MESNSVKFYFILKMLNNFKSINLINYGINSYPAIKKKCNENKIKTNKKKLTFTAFLFRWNTIEIEFLKYNLIYLMNCS